MKKLPENAIFYKISKKGYPNSYLFGSFHLPTTVTDNFVPENSWRFKRAEQIIVEADLDKFSDLKDRIEREPDSDALKQRLKQTMDVTIEFLKPNIGKYGPIELRVLNKAKQLNKLIVELDDDHYQVLIDSTRDELSIDFPSVEKQVEEYNLVHSDYARQDSSFFLFHKVSEQEQRYHERFLDTRNKQWITKLKSLLEKSSFICVGAGHLRFGNFGLVDLLRKEGFTVQPRQAPRASLSEAKSNDEGGHGAGAKPAITHRYNTRARAVQKPTQKVAASELPIAQRRPRRQCRKD